MAFPRGKRSPNNKGKGTYKEYDKKWARTEKAKNKRVANTKARRDAIRRGLKRKGDGLDVSHTTDGGYVLEKAKKNRARNGRNGKGVLKKGKGRKV